MPNALEEYLLKEAAPFRPVFTPFQPKPLGALAPPPQAMSYSAPTGRPSQADEVLMWQEWKKSGYRPEKLEPLHASM